MTYDIRLTIPTEEEIKGLSIDQILALFAVNRADMTTIPAPVPEVYGGGMKPIFFWQTFKGSTARPINTSSDIVPAAQYKSLGGNSVEVFEGSWNGDEYIVANPGRIALWGAVNTTQANTNCGDICVGWNDSYRIGNPIPIRDVSSWGSGGSIIGVRYVVAGDKIAWYSRSTSAGAANIDALFLSLLIFRMS